MLNEHVGFIVFIRKQPDAYKPWGLLSHFYKRKKKGRPTSARSRGKSTSEALRHKLFSVLRSSGTIKDSQTIKLDNVSKDEFKDMVGAAAFDRAKERSFNPAGTTYQSSSLKVACV